jgi:hypothetical protein
MFRMLSGFPGLARSRVAVVLGAAVLISMVLASARAYLLLGLYI